MCPIKRIFIHLFLCLLLFPLGIVSAYAQAGRTCTYTKIADIPAGSRTAHVIAPDLNRDGIPDIVGSNQGGMNKGTITVALGTGNGSFAAPVNYTLGEIGPYETNAADFNGDGYPDLAVELFGTADATVVGAEVDVFINKGDGTFKPFVPYATGQKVRAVTSADLNGDGKQDIIVANSYDDTAGVLLGAGDGTFGDRIDYPAGDNPHGVVAADFNGDGSLDVAISNSVSKGAAVSVLIGKGDGTLMEMVQYEVGKGAFSLDAGDLNGDDYPDIVSAGNMASSVSVLINTGNGTFKEKVDYPVNKPVAVTMGDLNGDGRIDVLSSSSRGTDLLIGNGDGTLQSPIHIETGNSYDAALADFDADGVMDFASCVITGSVVIMKGTCR